MSTNEASANDQAKGKPGAPRGNRNRLVHGARAAGLTLSSLRADERYIREVVHRFRRSLVAAVEAAHGELSLGQHGQITTACRAELCCRLVERWARQSERTAQERIDAAEKALQFSERRDATIQKLLGKSAAAGAGAADDPYAAAWRDFEAKRRAENK